MVKRDWKNDKDYNFTDNLDSHGWAWEFLRRNPGYRKDWEKELKNYFSGSKPHKLPNIDEDDFFIDPVLTDCKAKWGILCYVNPDTDNPIPLDFEQNFGRIYQKNEKFELLSNQVAAVFDLNFPIRRQIDLVKKRLQRLQKELVRKKKVVRKQPKSQVENWQSYLRVLDAKEDGANNRDIPSIVFKDKREEHPYDDNYYNKISGLSRKKRLI